MPRTLIIQSSEEEKNRKQLLLSIKKRRITLQKLVVKEEMLRVRLGMLQREYMVRVGSLVLKDNNLDLEIIRHRNIIRLMEEGMTYKEAGEQLKSTFYAEQLSLEQEAERIRQAEKVIKHAQEKSGEVLEDARKLWKKLISNFHPDLTQDPKEKQRREKIMKQVNQAYEEGDFQRLSKIESEHAVNNETPVARLEDILATIENEIVEHEIRLLKLKKSEWYKWDMMIAKSAATIRDIFADVEKKLLNDIVAKMGILRELRKEIEDLESPAG